MGKVIQMADWKNRKAKPDPLGRGKTFTYSPSIDPDTPRQTEVFTHLRRILERSIEANKSISRLPTVQEREMAAVASLGFTMEAMGYAKEHGLEIRRRPTAVGESYIFEVVGYGQILVVK